MPRTTVLVMIDGLDPEYLEYCPAPKLREMAKHGFLDDRAPVIGCGGGFHGFKFRENKDLGWYVFDCVLT